MAEPIRILHMIGSLNLGGSQMMVINILRNMDREKIVFDFVIDHPGHTYFKEELKKMGARIYVLPAFNGINMGRVIKKWDEFWRLHPEYKVIHIHVRSYASLFIPVAKKYNIQTIIHSHSISNGSGVRAIAKKILQFPLRYQADFYMACTKQAGEWLFGKKIVQSPRFYIVHNAINTELFRYNPEIRKKYREQLCIDDTKRVYIHVGRFHQAKNHNFLLDLFYLVHENDKNNFLILVGDGDEREKIINKIRSLGLDDVVLMLGDRDDIGNILQAADCFLFPSLYEGLGISAIEAQTAGLPCICSSNIPSEAAITNLCHFIPLELDRWIKEINKLDYVREDISSEIIRKGYGIHEVVIWMEKFYKKLTET